VNRPQQGYREIEHTADWELEVWGPDLSALLGQAAHGMYHLMGIECDAEPRQHRRLEIAADDREQLLVEFLKELLYLAESERLAFDRLALEVAGHRLKARLEGARIQAQTKEIKAVTYHRLEVHDTDRGLETRIVFDV
jgi:SHS2 domain-containing protein